MGNVTGSATLKASVKTINPKLARDLLRREHRNRRLNNARIERYAAVMSEGEWVLAEPLMFNCDGSLIDGQHRLQAVIRANKPVEFLVVEGYERERTFAKIGDGAPRTLSNWLEIQGEVLPGILATVIRYAARDAAGFIPVHTGGGYHFPPSKGIAFLDEHPSVREAVVDAPATVTTLAPRPLLCFCYWKFKPLDESLARQFLIDLASGASTGRGDPVTLLRNRLERNRNSKEKMRQVDILALIYKAWNACRRNEELRQLKWVNAEPFPEVE